MYLFFELLQRQFPNINGLCGPEQIRLYTHIHSKIRFLFSIQIIITA